MRNSGEVIGSYTTPMPPHAVTTLPPTFNKPFDPKQVGWALAGVIALHGMIGYGLSNIPLPDRPSPHITPPLQITFIHPVTPPSLIAAATPKPNPTPTINPNVPSPSPVKKNTPSLILPATAILSPQPQQMPQQISKVADEPNNHPTHAQPNKNTVTAADNQQTDIPVTQETPSPDTQILSNAQLDNDIRYPQAQQQVTLAKNPLVNTAQSTSATTHQAPPNALDTQALDTQTSGSQTPQGQPQPSEATKTAQPTQGIKQTDNQSTKVTLPPVKQAQDSTKKAETTKQVPSNQTPIHFSTLDGQAKLITEPKFNCDSKDTKGAVIHMSFTYTVDTQGKIKNLSIATPSGNPKLDKGFKQDAYNAKFAPFTQGGMPVIGVVTLPFTCKPSPPDSPAD